MVKIKEKQWFIRGNSGDYLQADKIEGKHETVFFGDKFCEFFEIIRAADTPQGLVDCGDLICTASTPYPRFVFDRIGKKCVIGFNYDINIKDITKIYTLDSNNNYIKRYDNQ